MHVVLTITAALLLLGCSTPSLPRAALERRVTSDEVRRLALLDTERALETAQRRRSEDPNATVRDEARAETEILRAQRRALMSKVDAFLERSGPLDELWTYRTHTLPPGHSGESGLALIRDGKIIDRLVMALYE